MKANVTFSENERTFAVQMAETDESFETDFGEVQTVNEGGCGADTGEDGGYYKPSISTDGDLSWEPSKADMPAVEAVNIRGPEGPQGEPGSQGPAGADGADGADGITPHIGDNGNWWIGDTDTGTPSRGEAGQDGAVGPEGPQGVQGDQGPQGEQGPIGEAGPQGETGPAGADVSPGTDGRDGAPGIVLSSTQPEPYGDGSYPVWLDPNGDEGEEPVTKAEMEAALIAAREETINEILWTDLDYIQGDATAYILTDYIPNSKTRVIAKVLYKPTSTSLTLFGSWTTNSKNRFSLCNSTGKLYIFGWGAGYTNVSGVSAFSEPFEVDMNRNILSFNGETVLTRDEAEWSGEYPLAIFANNSAGSIARKAPTGSQIWRFQIYEDDVLMHDFIPRKHLIDGYGLYDKVGKKFYGNAHTSGSFTGG